ncbi:MAG: DUF4126 domain-containing protein, partial [Planctomycetaceae bacterium]
MDLTLGLLCGIGLAAACGFRVFVPLLGTSIAAMSGQLQLSPGFEWMGTLPALITFGTATALEIGAYYIPWLDNLLDVVATPAAAVAGAMLTAAMVTDMSPFLKWTLAVIAGGGVATAVQTGTAALRGASTLTTAGAANPIISTVELATSILMTALAVLLPILAFVTLVLII